MDGSFYPGFSYQDMELPQAADHFRHVDTWNLSLGSEIEFRDPNFKLRLGAFTNNSSLADIPVNPDRRYAEQVDMLGFSANINFFVSEFSSYTVGGFYTGGEGTSIQVSNNQFTRLTKSHHIFSLLISTSYKF